MLSFVMQGFVTDQERALEELFGENVANSRKFEACLNTMATRVATVFASLNVWFSKLEHNFVLLSIDHDKLPFKT